jgi:hypothetical protein
MTKSHGWNEVFNMWDKKKMWEKATNISETSSFLASENVWDLIWTRVQSGDKKHHEREDIKSVMVLTYYCRYTTKLLLFSLTTHLPNQDVVGVWWWLDTSWCCPFTLWAPVMHVKAKAQSVAGHHHPWSQRQTRKAVILYLPAIRTHYGIDWTTHHKHISL